MTLEIAEILKNLENCGFRNYDVHSKKKVVFQETDKNRSSNARIFFSVGVSENDCFLKCTEVKTSNNFRFAIVCPWVHPVDPYSPNEFN
jgi:hypothetical protein